MFCTKCGKENKNSSKFCVKCGKELKESIRKREQEIYPIKVRAMLVNAIEQSSFAMRPKLPTRYDSSKTNLIIVVFGHNARNLSEDTKRNIAKQVGTDISLNEITWATESSFSPALLNKGWNCCIGSHAGWLLFAANGSDTIKSDEFTIIKKEPDECIPTFFSRHELEEHRKDESLQNWVFIIGCVIMVLIGLLILGSQ